MSALDLELGGCPPWAQLSGDVRCRVELLLWVLPHPCITTGTGESGKCPKCRRFHPGTALPGRARAKPTEVFRLSGDCRGPAAIPVQIPPVCAPVERPRILVSGIRVWDPSLSFPAPSFGAWHRAEPPHDCSQQTQLRKPVWGLVCWAKSISIWRKSHALGWTGIIFRIDP